MTCKLAPTRMSTTEDVQANTNTDVHKGTCKLALTRCPQQVTCKLALTRMSTTDDVLALTQICTQKMMFKLGTLLQL
ncbi:hypothetical protein DPMN_153876 [Dreissena polymorpha]|uniref:Uncharacterized protein n=1 Tax=Dreissena polymorpha TaxID=45954 RepID=A0A9D4FK42_DREPO|nr:hypothetical protein DPMN_153876 [Dreissena polymorpha]